MEEDDEFDSGDELFDGVDPDQLIPDSAKRKLDGDVDESVGRSKRLRRAGDDGPAHGGIASRMQVAHDILGQTFGYRSFRHEQEGAIETILAGKNALTIFPTGAGKSLCFQIPAMAFARIDLNEGSRSPGEHGITIVVSPLIALMKDQVDALVRRSVPAAVIDSTKTWEQQQQTSAALREGRLRILYCAPERLNNEGFVAMMQHVRGGVRLLAVDEAHCVSEWGHSFRPEYLKVARFADEIEAERVICLTATATPKVAQDICRAFKIEPDGVFRSSSYRPNLNLRIQAVPRKQGKFPLIIQFLKENSGPTLLYVTLQQQAVELAAMLKGEGFDAAPFHAGLKVEIKTQVQDMFLANKVRIVVATIAFGMGIDKPDIRNIVHFDLPSTIEEYCQQIGRAGRDGKTSNCLFYVCPDDWYIRENFARGDLPSRQSLKGLMLDIFGHENASKPAGETFKTSHYEQCRAFDIRAQPLSTIYASLELEHGLIRAITPEYSEYRFVPTASYFTQMKTDSSREAKVILASAVQKRKFYHVDVQGIVSRTGLLRADIVRKLNQLHDTGLVELKAGGIEQRYRILRRLPQSDDEIEALVKELHGNLSQRENDALRRVKEVEDFVTGDECLALALAQHFGMGLPGNKSSCGHCTHCYTGARTVMPPRPPKQVDKAGIQKILAACDARDDPRFLARIAFGIKSPRVSQLKMEKHGVFGSLADHDFESLLREFTIACDEAAA